MSTRYRIAIVEDDDETRRLLIAFARSTPQLELVGEYSSTEVALTALPRDQPDVVLMDINLPKMSGIECVRQLKPRMQKTQFLMLTVYADHDNIFAALAAGATGYLLKGTRREDLVAAIGQIMEGGSPMSSGIARKVVSSFVDAESTRGDLEKLSPKERSVLVLLTKGFLYKEIAESLSVSVPTVNTHIRHIYEKLQVQSRSQAIAKYFSQSS
jgi:DNA-binding NarL/FixJ family response regulator